MWPFKRKRSTERSSAKAIGFTQVDTTEHFGDHLSLDAGDWIDTIALNTLVSDGESMGLPPVDASEEDIYSIALQLSSLRESIEIPNDGVYCPTCHIANVNLSLLRTPCPKCGRELLKFGWD
ncbi:MAG TPA: hypothetical protein VJU86_06495 [Pyrinomonadaceae bacterium]|nr:hypothetical protein [Pyrinomonadaceae bacterium]